MSTRPNAAGKPAAAAWPPAQARTTQPDSTEFGDFVWSVEVPCTSLQFAFKQERVSYTAAVVAWSEGQTLTHSIESTAISERISAAIRSASMRSVRKCTQSDRTPSTVERIQNDCSGSTRVKLTPNALHCKRTRGSSCRYQAGWTTSVTVRCPNRPVPRMLRFIVDNAGADGKSAIDVFDSAGHDVACERSSAQLNASWARKSFRVPEEYIYSGDGRQDS